MAQHQADDAFQAKVASRLATLPPPPTDPSLDQLILYIKQVLDGMTALPASLSSAGPDVAALFRQLSQLLLSELTDNLPTVLKHVMETMSVQAKGFVAALASHPEVTAVALSAMSAKLPDVLYDKFHLMVGVARLYDADRFGWLEGRQRTLQVARSVADNLSSLADSSIKPAKVAAGLQIAGGVLSFIGLVAAPFTMGGSLALTALGTGASIASSAVDVANEIRASNAANAAVQEFKDALAPDVAATADLEARLGVVGLAWSALDSHVGQLMGGMFRGYANLPPQVWTAAASAAKLDTAITLQDIGDGCAAMHHALVGKFLAHYVKAETGMEISELWNVLKGTFTLGQAAWSVVQNRKFFLLWDAMQLTSARISSLVRSGAATEAEMLAASENAALAMERIAMQFGEAPLIRAALTKVGAAALGDLAIGLGAVLDVYTVYDGVTKLLANNTPQADELRTCAWRLRYTADQLAWESKMVSKALAAFARQPAPSSDGTFSSRLENSQSLVSLPTDGPGSCLLSPGGYYKLVMQVDGNLVLYRTGGDWPGSVVWASNTDRDATTAASYRLVMQPDANLVIYTSDYRPVWSSNTSGRGGAAGGPTSALVLGDDGNLRIQQSAPGPNDTKVTTTIWQLPFMGSLPATVAVSDIAQINGREVALLASSGQRVWPLPLLPFLPFPYLVATSWQTTVYQRFRATVQDGQQVCFFNETSKHYVTARPDGAMIASATSALAWEWFVLEFPTNGGPGEVHIKSAAHNKYVCAENGGGGKVVANRDVARGWETFTLVVLE